MLSSKERCNGDVARRTGNEFHYDMLARENVETLNGAGIPGEQIQPDRYSGY